MARRSRVATIPRSVKKIENTVWELSNGSSLAQSAGSVAIPFSTVGTSPVTLLRMRGEVAVYCDAVQAPARNLLVTMGIILVPEGSGTTVQYDPVTDGNAPWIWFESRVLAYEEPVIDVIDIPGMSSARIIVDNKAMRRIRPDVEMQFVVVNTTVGGASPINMNYQIRWLQGF